MVSFEVRNEGGLPINVTVCRENEMIVIHVFTKNLKREHLKNHIRVKEGEGAVIAEDKGQVKPAYIA